MKKLALLCSFLWFTHQLTCLTAAEMRPIPKMRAGIPPFTVIEAIARANQQSVALAAKQPAPPETTPYMTWLADCDARIHEGLVIGTDADKVYTVRNLGNQLALATGAIDYGVRQLYSPVLLITGHTGSEALRAFMEGYGHLGEAIRRDLDHLHVPLATTTPVDKKKQSPPEIRLLHLVEQNVDYQVAQAVDRYRDRVKEGRLVVIGGIIDLMNQYGEGKNRLLLININGEIDPGKLKKLRHLVRLDPGQLNFVGRRPPKGTTAPPTLP
ncbi:MAG: carbonic anhydrase [Thermodesulfobacteriota bacterium]